VATIFAVIGFAVGAFIVNWVGRTVFHADVTFDELVRILRAGSSHPCRLDFGID
jgi:hypothetical protein